MKFKCANKISDVIRDTVVKGQRELLKREDLGFWRTHERNEIWEESKKWGALRLKKHDLLVVIGMGGSSLGGQCWVHSQKANERVLFLNNLDPKTVEHAFQRAEQAKEPHFLIISKSGGTLEINCLLDILVQLVNGKSKQIRDVVSVVTEPKPSVLWSWARQNGVEILPHPMDVGGRFSAFTPAGLAPAAFAGVEIDDIRRGQLQALQEGQLVLDIASFYLDSLKRGEYLSVFWMYPDELELFGHWLNQLWAESLPKAIDRNGQVGPRVSVPLIYRGSRDQHSILQMLMVGRDKMSICFFKEIANPSFGRKLAGNIGAASSFLAGQSLSYVYSAQLHATEEALSTVGRATSIIEIEKLDMSALAQLLMTFELVIGVLGECLNINAFDQPGVELGKKITVEKLQSRAHL